MDGTYYQNPTFPSAKNDNTATLELNLNKNLDSKDISDIININKGKRIKAYVTFSNSESIRDSIYEGVIEAAIKDYFIISDNNTGKWYIIPISNLDYFEFDDRINY